MHELLQNVITFPEAGGLSPPRELGGMRVLFLGWGWVVPLVVIILGPWRLLQIHLFHLDQGTLQAHSLWAVNG